MSMNISIHININISSLFHTHSVYFFYTSVQHFFVSLCPFFHTSVQHFSMFTVFIFQTVSHILFILIEKKKLFYF